MIPFIAKEKVKDRKREMDLQIYRRDKLELPEDDSSEKERGIGVTDPEQLSVELLPQIIGFPTILIEQTCKDNYKKTTTK